MIFKQTRFAFLAVFLLVSATWSTSAMSLTIDMTIGTTNPNHYASRHPGLFIPVGDSLIINFTTSSPGDVSISYVAYDIDYAREVFVEFDGSSRKFLAAGSNNTHSSKQTMVVENVNAGSHNFRFQPQRADRRWGVSDITITTGNTETPPINDLLAELGCAPGQIIEATSTDEWRCVSQCPATIQAFWAALSNRDLINANPSQGFKTRVRTPRVESGVCSASIATDISVVYEPGFLPVATHTFRVSVPEATVTVDWTNDLGDVIGPTIFPLADGATARACAVAFGCPEEF